MEEKQKYLVVVSFSVIAEGDSQSGAVSDVATNIRYGFRSPHPDIKNLSVKVIRKEQVAELPKAIAEAPYADQLRPVNEEAVGENIPIPVAVPQETALSTSQEIPF